LKNFPARLTRLRRTLLEALKSPRAAIDLASIMVGVLVIGIIGGVIAVAVFAVIPWAQMEAAKSAVSSVRIAESVARVNPGDALPSGYRSYNELVAAELLPESNDVTAGTNNARTCYVVVSRAGNGTIFFATDKKTAPVEYIAGESKTDECLDLGALVRGLPSDGSVEAGPTQATILEAVGRTAQTSVMNASGGAIERGHVLSALENVRANYPTKTTAWTGHPTLTAAASTDDFSIGFDNGQDIPSGVADNFGTRGAALSKGDKGVGYVGVVFDLTGKLVVCTLSSDYSTATKLLAAIGGDFTCPIAAPISNASAITSMWAWGNSVDPTVDNRGENYASMTPANVAAFAKARGLTTVHLSVPWAANQGAVGTWLAETVYALHAEGITVNALGGENGWVDNPALAGQWVNDALLAADFDGIQLDVEPWAGQAHTVDADTYTPKLASLLDSARASGGSTPLGMDLPWWLAETKFGAGQVIDVLLPKLDSVAIVTFADHADTAGSEKGIIALARPAVDSAVALGKPFTIGVETDTAAVAGGGQFTFHEEGSAVLETETAKVRAAFGGKAGYKGVTVEHMRSWLVLKP
jgi:hypothetical protein